MSAGPAPVCGPPAAAAELARAETGRELLLQLLRSSGAARLRAAGGSMLPALLPGDVVTLRAFRPASDRSSVGEIVLFARAGRLFLHRVVAASTEQVITRGDSLPQCDPPLAPHAVLATAVARQRFGGRRVSLTPRRRPALARAASRLPAFTALLFVYARLGAALAARLRRFSSR